ncbi:hypothetical protein AB1N83_012628, partial [Pleurotus pulmonarius]
RLLYARR